MQDHLVHRTVKLNVEQHTGLVVCLPESGNGVVSVQINGFNLSQQSFVGKLSYVRYMLRKLTVLWKRKINTKNIIW